MVKGKILLEQEAFSHFVIVSLLHWLQGKSFTIQISDGSHWASFRGSIENQLLISAPLHTPSSLFNSSTIWWSWGQYKAAVLLPFYLYEELEFYIDRGVNFDLEFLSNNQFACNASFSNFIFNMRSMSNWNEIRKARNIHHHLFPSLLIWHVALGFNFPILSHCKAEFDFFHLNSF